MLAGHPWTDMSPKVRLRPAIQTTTGDRWQCHPPKINIADPYHHARREYQLLNDP